MYPSANQVSESPTRVANTVAVQEADDPAFLAMCEAREQALGRRYCLAGRTLTQPSPSRSLDSSFRVLQDQSC